METSLEQILEDVQEGRVEATYEMAASLFPPKLLGPTWLCNEDGSWYLPKLTLGWEVLGWCAEWLVNPDSGEPWMFTPEQARFILHYYEVDETGEFVHNKATFQRLKGHGKDPMAGALSMAELCGPVLFNGWRPDGQPAGKKRRTSLVQVVAVNKDQGLKNAVQFIHGMLPKKTIQEYRLDVQKESIQILGRPDCKIEAVSSSSRGAEGNRPNFVVLDETHHWVPNRGGPELYSTVTDNAMKVNGRVLAITNAYVPGEDSVAERIRTAVDLFHAGLAEDPGWLYDSLEAHPDAPFDLKWGPHIVRMCAGDSLGWVNWKGASDGFADTSKGVSRQQRMWYNRIVAQEDALYSESEWDSIRRVGLTGTKADLNRGDDIVLGFDGGKTDDATALVAIRIKDKLIVPLAIWQRPGQKKRGDAAWEVDPIEVNSEVHLAFFNYNVKAFYADVEGWEPYIRQWSDQYRERFLVHATGTKSSVGLDMRGNQERIIRFHEALMATIAQKQIEHNGDKQLRNHALNARRQVDNRYGVSFRKDSRESNNKVDGYAALLLAFIALNEVLESNKKDPSRYSRRLIQG